MIRAIPLITLVCICVAAVNWAADEPDDSGWSPAKMAEGVVRHTDEGFRALYVMNRDGSGVEFLGAAPEMISSSAPSWSHDGQFVAMDTAPEVGRVFHSKIFVLGVDGPFKGKMLDLGHGNTPDWSPDDTQISYQMNPTNPIQAKLGTWLMNADGTNRRWISEGYYGRWSPDGKLMLVHITDGNNKLKIVDLATRESRELLPAGWTPIFLSGSWSPDGKRIAFLGDHLGQQRVATIGVDGAADSIEIVFTNVDPTQQLQGPPAWSPDGKEIVFISADHRGGPRNSWHSYIYSVPADGSKQPVLVEGQKVGKVNRGLNWSPDGSKIVFSSER